ncbi:CidA/LrgA family protein [Vibrio sp.]|nr:CidA/LrgA family protein [Vibrio sp.]
MKQMYKYGFSFVILLAFASLGAGIQTLFSLPFPGSVIGMAMLFFALRLNIVPIEKVRPTGHLFIQYMVLLLIPACVAIVNYLDLLSSNMIAMFTTTAGASAIVLVTMSLSIEYCLAKKQDNKHNKANREEG